MTSARRCRQSPERSKKSERGVSSTGSPRSAAIVSASPGSIGGFGANHQLRQACVFLNMPVMQQPEAYLGHVTDDRFDAENLPIRFANRPSLPKVDCN